MQEAVVFKSIFSEATIGIIVVNRKGEIVQSNPYLENLFGYSKEELVGETIELLLPKKYKKAHVHHRDGYLKNPRPRAMGTHEELFGVKKDGSTFSVAISLSHTMVNNEMFAIGFVSDDTSRKKMLSDILDSQNSLEETQSLAHIGSFQIILPERHVKLSKEAIHIFGMDESQHANKLIRLSEIQKFIVPEDRQQMIKSFEEQLVTKSAEAITFKIKDAKGKERHLSGKREVILDQNKQVVSILGYIQDITPLKQYELELEEKILKIQKVESDLKLLNDDLERKVFNRTEELESTINQLLSLNRKLEDQEKQLVISLEKEKELNELKSRFVSMASHEFRTPLSTILSSANLLKRYEKESQQVQREKHIGRIKSSVSNLTNILNDFLSLSKIEEGKIEVNKEAVDLVPFVEGIVEEVSGLLKEGQDVVSEVNTSYDTIHSDPKILHNILLNLLSNGIKYSGKDDTVICRIREEDSSLIFEIIDQGIGIPKEDQKHLFSRFYRASNVENIQGTGLGLNIVKNYSILLGAQLSFTSSEGEGSIFSLKLEVE